MDIRRNDLLGRGKSKGLEMRVSMRCSWDSENDGSGTGDAEIGAGSETG